MIQLSRSLCGEAMRSSSLNWRSGVSWCETLLFNGMAVLPTELRSRRLYSRPLTEVTVSLPTFQLTRSSPPLLRIFSTPLPAAQMSP